MWTTLLSVSDRTHVFTLVSEERLDATVVCCPTSVSFISQQSLREPKRKEEKDTIDLAETQRPINRHYPNGPHIPTASSATQGTGHGTDQGIGAQLLCQKYVHPTPAHICKCARPATGTTGSHLEDHIFQKNITSEA